MQSSIQVLLDNYNNACFPGQTLTGRVECNFDNPENLRAIRIKFQGLAETDWYEFEKQYDHHHIGEVSTHVGYHSDELVSRHVRYHAEEHYLEAEYYLFQGGENFCLPPGKHTYPFSYVLPHQLPSSYEGIKGNIRYHVKVTISRAGVVDHEANIDLNVVSLLDLNYLPQLRIPANVSVDKTVASCWCINSGALTFTMSLPATGFVSGQEIAIGCHVENLTNVSVEHIYFKIMEETVFIAQYPRRRDSYHEAMIAGSREGGIGAHGDKSWTTCITILPRNIPNLIPCSIINTNYLLKTEVVLPWPHTNLRSALSITLGAIPLTGIPAKFPGGPPPDILPIPSASASEGTPLSPNSPIAGISNGFGEKPPSAPQEEISKGVEGKSPTAPPGDASLSSNPNFIAKGDSTYSYPSGGVSAPYTSGSPLGFNSAGGGVPGLYPSGGPPTFYPSSGSPYPPTSAQTSDSFAPPLYEETQKSKDKSGKPE